MTPNPDSVAVLREQLWSAGNNGDNSEHVRSLLIQAYAALSAQGEAGSDAVTEEMEQAAAEEYSRADFEWIEKQPNESRHRYALRRALTAALAARTGKGEA